MNIDPNLVVTVAEIIANLDFRTAVLRHANRQDSPWLISVGESSWQRRLVVEQVNESATEATFAILTPTQSYKSVWDIDTRDVERRITLSELLTKDFVGVKQVLKP